MKKSNQIIFSLIILLFVVIISTNAQDLGPINFDDSGSIDEAEAPINGLVYIAMAIGGYLGFRKINKNK
ncbi:MAG: hypothetical protein ACQESK_06450 [Bacteroidota bacterium]